MTWYFLLFLFGCVLAEQRCVKIECLKTAFPSAERLYECLVHWEGEPQTYRGRVSRWGYNMDDLLTMDMGSRVQLSFDMVFENASVHDNCEWVTLPSKEDHSRCHKDCTDPKCRGWNILCEWVWEGCYENSCRANISEKIASIKADPDNFEMDHIEDPDNLRIMFEGHIRPNEEL
eukprot:TRINITY_DN17294_c0_g1_i1.p1 TRINITY_DN17294_c0_g1~~TRINITY_DN17294_c0_g1_i1.p1  ORF type:complete len:194 (+),score=29.01 TRINITY_DN17294_c0_g1_i1:59-583(+)